METLLIWKPTNTSVTKGCATQTHKDTCCVSSVERRRQSGNNAARGEQGKSNAAHFSS